MLWRLRYAKRAGRLSTVLLPRDHALVAPSRLPLFPCGKSLPSIVNFLPTFASSSVCAGIRTRTRVGVVLAFEDHARLDLDRIGDGHGA